MTTTTLVKQMKKRRSFSEIDEGWLQKTIAIRIRKLAEPNIMAEIGARKLVEVWLPVLLEEQGVSAEVFQSGSCE